TLTGARLVTLFHESGGIGRLEGDRGFVLESTHSIASTGPVSPLSKLLALEGLRTMRGQRLAVQFKDGNEPVSLEVVGDANVTASGLPGSSSASSLAAQTLVFDLSNGNLSRARAIGAVDLKGAPAEGESTGLHMRSENLEAEFDPNQGALLRLEGRGEIRMSDEGMESEGSHTALDPNSDIWVISGEEGSQATSTMPGRRIEARRIEADRRNRTLSARGGVRASYQPASTETTEAAGSDALPFFRRSEAIYAMAGSLTLSHEGHVAHYEDRVRLWQGENRVEAASIDLDETRGTLRARQEVISSFRQPTAEGAPRPANPSDEIVTIAAAAMTYDRASNKIHYDGPVLVTQASLRLTADDLTVTMEPSGKSAEMIEATGSVEMRDRGRNGTGDKLVVHIKENTILLTGIGREARIQDESSQQVVRGSSLTLDRTGDRILVESEMGGRTWITLKPRQKGSSDRAADPQH
ncbi:MAG TPA: LptA/OstA family protein, partial [Candidatus Polarisedimenticolia bacterium]|nr:LptA/OstA family protein [Candidatus Polarisedimenticolia bacterium]